MVAQDLVEQLQLSRLLVIPAAAPPHRTVDLPASVRFDLTQRMFAGVGRIEVSDVEHDRPSPSYTIDTLQVLASRFPESRLVLVMGADQFAVIDTWKDFERLSELADIAVMRRGNEKLMNPAATEEIDYIVVDVMRIDVSSSQVRARLREKRSIRFLVPESIRQDIERAWAEHVAETPSELAST